MKNLIVAALLTGATLRGGHPRVMQMLWDKEVTIDQAATIQNCIDETNQETTSEKLLLACIRRVK